MMLSRMMPIPNRQMWVNLKSHQLTTSIDNEKSTTPDDLQALLASAINLATDNPLVRNHLADALNAYHEA